MDEDDNDELEIAMTIPSAPTQKKTAPIPIPVVHMTHSEILRAYENRKY
jgi:hypothetical protein